MSVMAVMFFKWLVKTILQEYLGEVPEGRYHYSTMFFLEP